ncbi:serine/threonine-protein kinase [Alteromonas sp. M12]|uniref:serine/threonine-protein kinase n=1 Tax=Alteromonas sp. M12 TaxID=3135644 RepID=UPI00319DEDFD
MDENILALPQGTKLNHYIIESVLGQGGFGVVYKAHHAHLNDEAVIKEFLPVELASRQGQTVSPHSSSKHDLYADCLNRFMREGSTLVRLKHKNVVRCRDLFTANGTAYLVMDFEDGLALDELISSLESQGQHYSEQQLMHFLIPLADGLAYIHSQGVLHRDIKPANIFIRRSTGLPVLIDFGAAKQNFALASQSQAPYTEFYAPMEQIEGGGEAKATIDIYAFGALMYRIVTGTVGVKAESRALAMVIGKDDPLAPAASLAKADYSESFLTLIDDCLKFKAEDRPQTMAEVKQRLQLIAEPFIEVISDPAPQPFHLLNDLIDMAGSDGIISESAMRLILSKAKTLNIDAEAAKGYILTKAAANHWKIDGSTTNAPEKDSRPSTSSADKPEPPFKKKPEKTNKVALQEEQNKAKKTSSFKAKLLASLVFVGILVALPAIVDYQQEQERNRLAASYQQQKESLALKLKAEDENAWAKAKSSNTAAAYQVYLDTQQFGQYRNAANSAIAELKIIQEQQQARIKSDEADWAIAKKGNSALHYQGYLDKGSIRIHRQEALDALAELTKQGLNPTDSNEQFILGYNFDYGKDGRQQSYEQALYWYKKAADQGETGAMNNAGLLYKLGQGVEQSYSEAVKFFRKSAELGNAYGANNLGAMYRDGIGVTQSHQEANKWFKKAVEKELASAYVSYGYQYYKGHGVTQSYSEALKYYRLAADQNNRVGQYNVAIMYENGDAVPQSESEAIKWYRLSAKQGYEKAQKELENRNLTW